MHLILSAASSKKLAAMAELAVNHATDEWITPPYMNYGGYFRSFVLFGEPGDYWALVPIHEGWHGGHLNRHHESQYYVNSFEKAIRLCQRENAEHVSSFQSRRPGYTYAGAIRFPCVIPELGTGEKMVVFSFSGLPELADEAICVLVAEHMRSHRWEIEEEALERILRASDNKFYKGELVAA